jgi:transposase
MARAKAQLISRPCLAEAKQKAIYGLTVQGISMNQISKRLGIAYRTVYNYVKKAKIRERNEHLGAYGINPPIWKKNP